MSVVRIAPKGQIYANAVFSACAAGDGAEEYARRRYGPEAAYCAKGILEAGGINSGDWGAVLATQAFAEFFEAVVQGSILGRLPLRQVALNIRTQLLSAGFTAWWAGGGRPRPLSKAAIEGDTLVPLTLNTLAVFADQLFRFASPNSEAQFRNDMIRALREALDGAFVDPSNAGSAGVSPASVTNGLTPLSSTGNPGADVAAIVAAFNGDFETAAWVTDPTTGAEIALARDSAGSFLFPDAGPRGGSILGMPLITSRSSPRSSSGGILALIDGQGIAYGAESVRVAVSRQGTVEMEDAPTNDATDGTATEQVSLYQTNCVAVLGAITANWRVVRDAVAYVADATYPTEVA